LDACVDDCVPYGDTVHHARNGFLRPGLQYGDLIHWQARQESIRHTEDSGLQTVLNDTVRSIAFERHDRYNVRDNSLTSRGRDAQRQHGQDGKHRREN
jgi:hypothetical protein